MLNSKAQIIATLGPSSFSHEIINRMCEKQLGVVRLNFSWQTLDEHANNILMIRIEKVPFVQSDIISRCKKAGKTVIVATQMMLSMTNNTEPTRAEVTDVAEAILEGADCVMLSEETASGKYPVESVAIMEKIVLEAEKHLGGKDVFDPLVRIVV